MAGCTIFIAAGVILLGLVAWTIWTLVYQSRAISEFTDESATPTELIDVADTSLSVAALEAKLSAFDTARTAGEKAEIALTADELNLAIAHFDRFSELRRTFFIDEIRADGSMLVSIHFQLGSAPFSKRENHLNGDLVVRPVLLDGEPVLRVDQVIPSRGNVPEPFVEHLSPYRIFERYMEDDELLTPLFKQLTGLKIVDSTLVATIDPASTPPDTTDADLRAGGKRALLLFMSISSIVLMLIVIALIVAKRKNTP